ncbi:hypothetical protein B0H34DRAFT_664724 [Crassisporium funariophilum]|nr:hypothetical protein B0H34DRAFT_664724 [Crassisporium funariophilum]
MSLGLVWVDDMNSGIHYEGPWFEAHGNKDGVGFFGPPFRSSLHGVNENASFSFNFSGPRIHVLGTSDVEIVNNVANPSFECFVDGVSIESEEPSKDPLNHWPLCGTSKLHDGEHVFTLNATVRNRRTFWFDMLDYIPTRGTVDQADICVSSVDPRIHYGPGWKVWGGLANITSEAGSKVTFEFTGVSVSWYGVIPGNSPAAPSSATYSVDGNTPATFLLSGEPSSPISQYNRLLFQTPLLSLGQHTLEVVHGGDSRKMPLTLDYLVVQAGNLNLTSNSIPGTGSASGTDGANDNTSTKPSTNTATTATTTATTSASLGPNPASGAVKVPAGGIAGAVVAGVVLLIIVTFLVIRRRNKRQKNHSGKVAVPTSSPSTPGTDNIYQPHGGAYFHPPQTGQLHDSKSSKKRPETAPGFSAGTVPSTSVAPTSNIAHPHHIPDDPTLLLPRDAYPMLPRLTRDEDSGTRTHIANRNTMDSLPSTCTR